MKPKALLALMLTLGLVAAACGSDSESDSGGDTTAAPTTAASDDGGDDGSSDDSASSDDAVPAEILTDYGVTDTTIRLGLNVDVSGPFSTLVGDIVAAQTVYWDWVNDNGGIAGRQIELEIIDSGYATDKGIENYAALAQESEEGVVMIAQSTGSPITFAVYEDAEDDDMLMLPLSWYSAWPEFPNAMGKQATYCVESMNGVSWLKDKVEADGEEAKLAIISRPGEYGLDGATGAALAAEALGIEVVYDGTDQLAGDDRTAVISQLVNSGATMVWLTSTGGETLDIFGNAVSQGFEAEWSGNQPSFDYKLSGPSDFAAEFDQYFWPSAYNEPWGSDTPGMQVMVAEMTERRPDLPDSESYAIGWIEGIIVQSVLEQAAANGDMTRAGVVEAASQIGEIDFGGLTANQSFFGDYDDIVMRETYIYDFDATSIDIGTLGDPGEPGLTVLEGPFVSDIAANYEFGERCS